MKHPKSALLLITLILPFTACQTAPEIEQLRAGDRTYQGQLRYAGGENPIIGEVIVHAAPEEYFRVEFLSGPGFPLMLLRMDGNRAVAEGAIARGRWQGAKERAPLRIAGWFILPEAFAQAAGRSGTLRGEDWTAISTHSGGRLTRLEVSVPASGERFTFHFAD